MKTPLDRLPYWGIPDLVELLRFPSEEAARCWARRQRLRHLRRGRALLFKRTDVEAALGAPYERDEHGELTLLRKAR